MRLGPAASRAQEGRQSFFLYSVEHKVPVHTFTTALESVGDKILSHHQSQPPVYKEPSVQCLPRGTGKGGRPSLSWGTMASLGMHRRRRRRRPSPRSRPSPSPSFGRGRPGCTSSLVQENPWLLSLPPKVRESAVTDFALALG